MMIPLQILTYCVFNCKQHVSKFMIIYSFKFHTIHTEVTDKFVHVIDRVYLMPFFDGNEQS